MLKLEQVQQGTSIEGIEPGTVVTVAAMVPIDADARQIFYKLADGSLRERLLSRDDEEALSVATETRPWSFDGDGAIFQLAVEAKRIELAYLFDPMMAVHSSNVEPLPHQLTAVYESMLPRQPLRFVLADDPGAGKTIMAGLYMRELIMRADAQRILVVPPGGLVEQWRDELFEKFGLEFRIYSPQLDQASPSGNAFEDYDFVIARLDQIARNDGYQDKLVAAGWDLVVFDEAHKLSAHFWGKEIKRTRRFQLAEKLRDATRHLLLMTATPHNGKEEDFQLFLSLLDQDRFYGRFRDGVERVDASDLMRRMIKEELVRFDGRPLFPERRAYTVNYELSPAEAALYERVTEYVKTEMGKADRLEGQRRGSVGFALTILQRRVASSPEAIYQSLRRRRERLERRLEDDPQGLRRPEHMAETLWDFEDDDELSAEEMEALEEQLVDEASTARTRAELEAEIAILKEMQDQALKIVHSGQDRKWDELSRILQDDPHMRDAEGRRRKIIIFSEHRDTLMYLHGRIADVLADPKAIAVIHGNVKRDDRRRIQEEFRHDPKLLVLVATDAAGEGVNLQNANLMVNYDLPWNPNRLEQRFGRIHRIGQQEVCHLWNLVAPETREGDVYHRLLEKIEVENEALDGRVFDILGEVFDEASLKKLMLEAIRYGDQPEVRARLHQQVDTALDHTKLLDVLERNALAKETMSTERLYAVREEMEKAEARRLQPHFIQAFFTEAFSREGGTLHPRELERFEITHVPVSIRERDRKLSSRQRREPVPVVRRYERVCFKREAVAPTARPGLAQAKLLHPGHALMQSLTDLILERDGAVMRQGSILVDRADDGAEPSLLLMLTHELKAGDDTVISQRLQFVRVHRDGRTTFAGWAPHLDLESLDPADRPHLDELLAEPWLDGDIEQRALSFAASRLVPDHRREVERRHVEHVNKTLHAVHERLTREIAHWENRYVELKADLAAGKQVKLSLDQIERRVFDLGARLEQRRRALLARRSVASSTPVLLGGALVVPHGLLATLRGQRHGLPTAEQLAARQRTEQLSMATVRRVEEARGCRVVDVSADKCGWDLTSHPPEVDGRLPESRHIEVKGRLKGGTTLTVTRNEMLYAINQVDKFVLAIVLVDPHDDDAIDGPYYIREPFDREPGWGVSSINFEISALIERAEKVALRECP